MSEGPKLNNLHDSSVFERIIWPEFLTRRVPDV